MAGSIEFYGIGLACEAAPEIGCGIRAKPVLRELEADAAVAGAWLSRSGDILAVRWRSASTEEARLVERFPKITNPGEREALLDSLAAGAGWYGAQDIDRLSVEEASIIAERVVRRLIDRKALGEAQATRLAKGIAEACERFLTHEAPGTAETREVHLRNAILQAGRAQLADEHFLALNDIVTAFGYRP